MSGDFLLHKVCMVCSDSPPAVSSLKMALLWHVRRPPNRDEFQLDWERKRGLLPISESLDFSDTNHLLKSGFLQGLAAPDNSTTSNLCALVFKSTVLLLLKCRQVPLGWGQAPLKPSFSSTDTGVLKRDLKLN